MAYKKYIKRGGKLYGPYIYESKREGDKVVSVYKGTIASEKNKIKKNFAPAIVIFSLIILAMLFIFINLPHPTGKITLQVSPAYNQGEAISGALKLSLKAGELIPASSVISADLNGEKRQFLLSELLTQGAAEGSFYIENAQLSGSGAGYGIAGTKTIYPEIQFKLKTIKERAKDEQQMPEPAPQQNPPQTEQPSETPSSPIEQPQIPQETSTEQPLGTTPELPAEEKPIEQPKQEQKAEEKETKNEEKQAEQEQKQEAKEEKSGITGEVVSEKEEKMIDVVVSANQPFSYAIEEGESAEIVQGSVRLAGEKDKKIDESALNLQIQASKITITTSYSETETGFGADFTGGEAKTIEISLEKLDITAQEGSLQVALSYNGAEIISASADVDIGYKAPDIPQEEPKEIPVEQPGEEISEIPTIPEENLTNATAPKVNVTIPENITELNITGQNITNATLQNVTELNITELNITEINITELNLSLIRNIPDITLEKNSNTTLNLSEYFAGAEGYKAVQPENISISIDLENALIVPEANFTGIRNASITAYRENESIQEDFVINVQETNITIQTIQYQAKIGHPVKWKKIITTENPENITLKLPANSTNITLKEIKDSRIIEESQINTITGQAVSGKISVELSLKKEPKFITFLKKLFRLKGATGRAVEAEETKQARQEVEVNITAEENIEYELEYYTDAPYAIETKKGNYSKEIIVSSNIHYEDVLSYAFLPFEVSSEKAIKLKWKIFAWQNLTALNLTAQETEQLNNQSELVKEIGFDAYDTDNNTKIDYIEWIVPALSNQTYEISITILNVHSHPSLYGNWTVEFETSGQANLTITATQDLNYTNLTTRWSNESENETAFDLKFLEVRCGNETKQYEWLGENCSEQECSALITDYSCNVTAQEISRVLTPKLHVLKFNFGGQEAYAYNAVGNETSESDNNEWRMFRRYLNHTGFTNASDPIRIGTNITFYTTGAGGVYSSPAVANGFVYVGSNDAKLYQLNASNVSQMIASYSAGGSIYSSPAVGDNYVYVLNYDTNLYQLNASNVSKLIANFSTGGGLYNTQSSPAVFNGSVYVGSTNNMLYQLNATNVSQKIANFSTGEAIYTTPAVANSYVYFGSNDNQVYQLNASNVSQKVANFSTSGAVYSSPAISGGFVYVGSDDKNIYQLNASNVSQKVANFSTGGVVRSSPAVSGGFVYVGSDDNQVYQLNASNVSLLIANFSTRGAISFSSPALTSRFVYVGSNDSKLYQLNASNVSLFIASYSTSGAIESSPAISGGFVYVGSLDRNIYQLGGPDIVPPDINFTSPTPPNATTTANTSVQINITITNASDLSEFKFNWNGTNYTFYNDSLVLMFNFDNVSAIGENATRAVDVSKQGNNGTITGAVWNISGRYGSTLNFDANNDYVVIPKETNLITGTNSFTIEAWINPKNPGGGVQNLIAWTEAGSAVQFDHISGAGSVAIWACSKSLLANNYNFTANVWSHIVYTRNGNSWRTYVNGAQIGTDVTDTCSLGTPNRDYYIGAEATAPSQFYNGSIDEFRIWNRSLTSSEINQSYISNLYKYANDSWAFYTNQSNLSAGVTYTYRGFVKDIAGNTNQTELRTLTISGAVPTHTAPILNSTNVTLNDTNQNLTCYNQSTSDADGDYVVNSYAWYRNNNLHAAMPKKSDNGLVLYMPFDENRTDNVTYDYALNNNGSLGNVTSGTQPMWNASGRISGAFIFDGNDDIAVNSSGSLNITTNITLSCWVKLKSYIQLSSTANWHSSCIYKTGGPLGSNVIGYGLLIANNTGAVGLAIDTNNVASYAAWTSNGISLNEWHYLVGTYNGSDMKVYVDGIMKANTSRSGIINNSNYPLHIGNSVNEYADPDWYSYLNGSIDEAAIWNRSLSATEIWQLYLAGKWGGSVMHSSQTETGENWTCQITPMDYTQEGTALNSSQLNIRAGNTTPVIKIIANKSVNEDSAPQANWIDLWYNKTDNYTLFYEPFDNTTNVNQQTGLYDNGVLVDDYALSYNTTNRYNASKGTIEFWIKLEWNGTDNKVYRFFDEGPSTLHSPNHLSIGKYYGTTNYVFFVIDNSTQSGGSSAHEVNTCPGNNCALADPSVGNWTTGQWHHIAATWDNTIGIKLYVDGNLIRSLDTTWSRNVTAPVFYIGSALGTQNYANVTFDELRISSIQRENFTQVWDAVDNPSAMNYSIISQTNASLINCSIVNNRYINCSTPAANQTGSSNVSVQVMNTRGLSANDTFTITVLPVSDAPTITNVTIYPSTAYTNSTLNCSALYSDADNDAGTAYFSWYKNNARQSYATSLVAGNGTGSYAEGNGSNATLNYPSYLAIDSTGNNIYFTDYTNCRVRRISLATNTTSLVAGNGDCSYAEGTGSAAGFVGVYGIASRGDMLFVSDYDNCRVRKINATTNTTYLAAGGGSCNYTEGIGSSAGFNNPAGLAANQNGTYLYVSDYTNNRIRRIDLRTNTTSLIAGNGTAGYAEGNVTNSMINGPYGLAISPDDLYLYFSDWNNHLIRMVDLTTNITSFISGNRTAGYKEGANNQSSFRNPDQLSIDSTGTLLYLADANNNMIRRINLTTNTTSLIAGNGTASYAEGSFMDARFNVPEGIVINPAGTKLYVSDANNNRIRAINLQNAYDSTTANATSGALAWTNILVPSTALVQNDNWTCSAIVYDGVLWSSWSNSTNVTIQQADLTSPVIHLISPANATFTNTSSQTFRCNITDNSAIANLTLYVWNSTNSNIHTNITNLSGTSNSTNFTFTLPYDNAFKWNCLGSDSPGNSNFSSEGNYTITLDTTLPAINLTYPRNITYNINVSAINYTVSDTNLQACWYSTNNGAANTTITCGNNATGLTSNEGSNTWLVSANDSLNNINVSRITFYKDTISPNISITSPANSSNFSTNNVTINYTISDSGGISSCWYTNTSGLVNYSVTCGQNISRIWNEGINNITIYVNDSLNNANSSSVRFIVDTIFPTNLSFGAGTQNNGMNASANSIYANVTAFNDTNFANATFTLWNLSAVVNSTAFAAATYSINWTNLQDTNYTYEVNVTDIVNHVNSTGLRKILLDTAYPLISYGAGTNASGINVSRTWIYVNVSMTETNFRNITFRLFNSTANANTTTYATNTFFINFTGLAQENYTYNVTITDTANNMNTTETRGIRIDLTAPAISFSCAPASVQAGGIVACTCIATDNVDLNPAEAYTANPSTANIGTFTTTCTATDSAGNSASLDTTYTVELGGGGGGGGGGGSVPCSPSWACGSWSSCANGQQTRTCTDTKSCSTTAGKPAETQPCEINEPVIEYYSPELQVSTRNNSDVTFTIKARDISGISGITLNTKWFVDGVLAKEDNGGISIESSLLHNFNKNAAVKAVVSNSYKTKEILWNVIVLNIACNEKWQCFWSSCNSEGYSYSQNCIDQNNCGTNAEKPVSVLCYIDPVTGEMSPFAGSTTCIPKWICGEWSECNVVYKMEDALKGETLTEGRQERTCDDINRCQPSRLEYQPCVFNIPISMRIVELCNENYIEIYDLQKNMLVSRLKESRIKDTTKLDIRLATANLTGYCDYCYDKIKDYDEEAVDCGGANCPICTEIPFGIDYRDIIAGWAKFISWSLLPVLIAVFISSIVSLRKRRIYEAERLRHIEPRRIRLRRQKPQGIIKERFFR